LRNGDFLPGDRIYIVVLGDSALTDTFTVRGDRRLQLPNIPDVTLSGVLDSELNTFLTTELSRYLKNPTVTATGMVRWRSRRLRATGSSPFRSTRPSPTC
jgi:protein involved in polysaccharide export with SLBB domain